MSNVTTAATSTVTTLLATVSTGANVVNATLISANIVARDLQERTQNWAQGAAIERKLSAADATEVALENHAIKRVSRIEERTNWFQQNPDRRAAFEEALKQARELLTPATA